MKHKVMQYTVLSNLKHDGELFVQGSQVDLTPEQAAPLLADKVISDKKIPVIVQKDWKNGPDDIVRSPDEEVKETGDVGNVNEDDGEEVEQADADTSESGDSEIASGNKPEIAGDDTGKIDSDADAGL